MGALENERGVCCVLWADFLIGRAPDSALRLAHDSVSWRHANVRWNGSAWELQDLGSLNGSFLNDTRLPPGERARLRMGDRLRFGDDPEGWLVFDTDAPEAAAVAVDDGERVAPAGGLIALPDSVNPELTIYRNGEGVWVAESSDGVWLPKRDEVLVAGGRAFRFEPGGAVHATSAARRMTPASIALELAVSRNEEQVEVAIVYDSRSIRLRPRAHGYLLLTLARARLADQDNPELRSSSQGWIDQAELIKQLATTPAQLALDIYRARRQLEAAGVEEAAQVIERRTTSKEVRIGVEKLAIHAL